MRAERFGELKARLIDAAERAIAGGGLKALRARDLASDAGCAVGQIYNVFPDLDTLVLEANRRTLALLGAVLRTPEPSARTEGAEEAVAEIVRLALAYLSFADEHRGRWRALFEHRMAGGARLPDWYAEERNRIFDAVEAPLMVLRGDLPEEDRRLLARTLFSATHGIVDLGLDEKLDALPSKVLRSQLETVVRATASGLLAGVSAPGRAADHR